MKYFEDTELELICFEESDVIATSGGPGDSGHEIKKDSDDTAEL